MNRFGWVAALLAVGLVLAEAGTATAGRTTMVRTSGQRNDGSRRDQSVPYLNNGSSGFGAYSVAPRIYSSPIVDDPKNPQAKPVFNLQFYGSVESYGDKSNGA